MNDETVTVRLRLPAGQGIAVVILPVSEGASVDEAFARTLTMNNIEDRRTYDWVKPGVYRLSIDRIHWTEITVSRSPSDQTFDLRDLQYQ